MSTGFMAFSIQGSRVNMSGNIDESTLTARASLRADAPEIAAIYNEGIADRVATFETEPRTAAGIEPWVEHSLAMVSVVDEDGRVVGYAVAHPYADRCCYRGIGEFSVYVRRSRRGQGIGRLAIEGLVQAAREAGLWKLLSRVFPENTASLALMRTTGFREVGVHEKHGKLDGVWRDTVIVELLIPENID
jgi:phosphinothricin acetyltransferase